MTRSQTERFLPREVFHQNDQGVAAVFSFRKQLYGMALPQEDCLKVEYVLDPSRPWNPITYGHLTTCSIGLISGKIESSDTGPSDALTKELRDELAELLHLSPQEVTQTILPTLQWQEPQIVENFQVVQGIQKDVNGKGFLRGSFEIFLTTIDLPSDIFTRLEPVLTPLSSEKQSYMRPFVAALFSRGYLESTDIPAHPVASQKKTSPSYDEEANSHR